MSRFLGYVKLGLIPVLAGILYVVVRGGATPTADDTTNLGPASKKTPTLTVETKTPNQIDESAVLPLMASDLQPTLPLIRLDDIADVDPFDRKMIFPPNELTSNLDPDIKNEEQSLVSSLGAKKRSAEELKLKVVFQTRSGISAMLDDRIIRVGDTLEDGRQVIEITPKSLILASPPIH